MLHEVQCPLNGTELQHSDEAKRLSDEYRLHRLADHIGSIGHWFALRMQDGTSADFHTLYTSRDDCVSHQPGNQDLYLYVQIVPSDMPVCQADMYLSIQRRLHERTGIRAAEPRGVIPRLMTEDMKSQMNAILRGGRPSNLRYGKG